MSLGKYLKTLRKEKGISTRELARRSGVSQPYLSQLETGKHSNPAPEVIRKLSKFYGVPYLSFMGYAGFINEDDIKEYLYQKED